MAFQPQSNGFNNTIAPQNHNLQIQQEDQILQTELVAKINKIQHDLSGLIQTIRILNSQISQPNTNTRQIKIQEKETLHQTRTFIKQAKSELQMLKQKLAILGLNPQVVKEEGHRSEVMQLEHQAIMHKQFQDISNHMSNANSTLKEQVNWMWPAYRGILEGEKIDKNFMVPYLMSCLDNKTKLQIKSEQKRTRAEILSTVAFQGRRNSFLDGQVSEKEISNKIKAMIVGLLPQSILKERHLFKFEHQRERLTLVSPNLSLRLALNLAVNDFNQASLQLVDFLLPSVESKWHEEFTIEDDKVPVLRQMFRLRKKELDHLNKLAFEQQGLDGVIAKIVEKCVKVQTAVLNKACEGINKIDDQFQSIIAESTGNSKGGVVQQTKPLVTVSPGNQLEMSKAYVQLNLNEPLPFKNNKGFGLLYKNQQKIWLSEKVDIQFHLKEIKEAKTRFHLQKLYEAFEEQMMLFFSENGDVKLEVDYDDKMEIKISIAEVAFVKIKVWPIPMISDSSHLTQEQCVIMNELLKSLLSQLNDLQRSFLVCQKFTQILLNNMLLRYIQTQIQSKPAAFYEQTKCGTKTAPPCFPQIENFLQKGSDPFKFDYLYQSFPKLKNDMKLNSLIQKNLMDEQLCVVLNYTPAVHEAVYQYTGNYNAKYLQISIKPQNYRSPFEEVKQVGSFTLSVGFYHLPSKQPILNGDANMNSDQLDQLEQLEQMNLADFIDFLTN